MIENGYLKKAATYGLMMLMLATLLSSGCPSSSVQAFKAIAKETLLIIFFKELSGKLNWWLATGLSIVG